MKTDEEVRAFIAEHGKQQLHVSIIEDNAAMLDLAMDFSESLINHYRNRMHPVLFAYGSIMCAIQCAHANKDHLPKELFLQSVEALYDNYDQFIKEDAAGLAFPEGSA